MSEYDRPDPPPFPAEPNVVTPRGPRFSLVWLVPLIAALVGLSLVVKSYVDAGPQIRITFDSAEGLEAGKTEVRYKNVAIGHLRRVGLTDDRAHVIAVIDLDKSAASIANAETRFWIVRPRVGLGGISGLGTLLSGAFIGVDAGVSDQRREDFVGLETPPLVLHGEHGRSFTLHARDLGSLDIGAPVYFRRIQVGRVVRYSLDSDGKGVSVQIFIASPTDALVTSDSRFWNASGVDVTLNANGLKVDTQSLVSMLAGGIAFSDAPYTDNKKSAADGSEFTLFGDHTAAMSQPDGPPIRMRMRFAQSIRGLTAGAPVDFLGINIGVVNSVALDYDPQTKQFPAIVEAQIFPQRLGAVDKKIIGMIGDSDEAGYEFAEKLIEHGLRAQLRSGNLLTGQLYVALDFVKNAKPVEVDSKTVPIEVPTIGGTFDELQPQVAEIVNKVSKIPFDEIGRNLNATLASSHNLIERIAPDAHDALGGFAQVLSDLQHTLDQINRNFTVDDAPFQRSLNLTLQELQRTAQSIRVLTDYLQQHPESLLRGKPADPVPNAGAPNPGKAAGPQPGSPQSGKANP